MLEREVEPGRGRAWRSVRRGVWIQLARTLDPDVDALEEGASGAELEEHGGQVVEVFGDDEVLVDAAPDDTGIGKASISGDRCVDMVPVRAAGRPRGAG